MRLCLHLGVLLLSLTAAATSAFAAEDRTYEGTAGTGRIVMALDDSTVDVDGRYFYDAPRRDIGISGKREGDTLTLESDITGDKITLKVSGTDLVGTLVTSKGHSVPLSLHPAALPRDLPSDLPPGLSLYQKLQLAGLRLTPQQTVTANGKTLRWYREGVTGMRLFRIESGYAPAATAAVNHALARQHWTSVSDSLGCTDSNGGPGIYVAEKARAWLGAHVMSYAATSSWDCAHAAHPDFGTDGHSFDMATGRELTLDEVLHFGTARVPAQDSDPWFAYRDRVFGRSLAALLRRYHPGEMARPKDAEDCDYRDAVVWKFPSWALTAKGLWVGAIFGRVERRCDSPDWAIIPWARLSLKP